MSTLIGKFRWLSQKVQYTRRSVFLRPSTIHVVCCGSEKNLQRRRSYFLRRHHVKKLPETETLTLLEQEVPINAASSSTARVKQVIYFAITPYSLLLQSAHRQAIFCILFSCNISDRPRQFQILPTHH